MKHVIPTEMGPVELNVKPTKQTERAIKENMRALRRDHRADAEVLAEYERVMAEKRKALDGK